MSKHTEGPWKVFDRSHGSPDREFDYHLGWEITTTTGEDLPQPNRGMFACRADARLAAAAPEMLEVLKTHSGICQDDCGHDDCAFARKVIAKAEGR